MESFRLKNIVILILLILNLFLAALLVNYRLQGARARQNLLDELNALFTANAISLSEDLELDTPPLASLSVQRNLDKEAEIAATLLGESVEAQHQGGGIYSYTGSMGTVHFRSGGNFDYVPLGQSVEDPQAFCDQLFEAYGYRPAEVFSDESGTSYTATQYLGETAIYNCTLTIQFLDGQLLSLSGSYVSTASTTPTPTSLTAVDALVQLLDYRNATGMVCNSVQDIQPVYELQSGPSASLQLAAKWQITADAYQYYVDCNTGNVVRA